MERSRQQKRAIRSCMSRGTQRRPSACRRAGDCPLKPSGNTPLALGLIGSSRAETNRARLPLGRWCATIGLVNFEIVGDIEQVETIATGRGVKMRALLQKAHGKGRWRKLKGVATVRLPHRKLRRVELHWYDAHGISRRDFKIKRFLD